jgi:hypothetical protein
MEADGLHQVKDMDQVTEGRPCSDEGIPVLRRNCRLMYSVLHSFTPYHNYSRRGLNCVQHP